MQNLSFFQQYPNNLITSSMNKLQQMHNLLKESKKLDLIHRLHQKHLYKSQRKQRKIHCLIDYSGKEQYSLVYINPYNNESDQYHGRRKIKRNKSTSENKNDFFLTPMITLRQNNRNQFQNVKNVNQTLNKSITRSVRFNQLSWDSQHNQRKIATGKRRKDKNLQQMGENFCVLQAKKQNKLSDIRIRKAKKTQYNCQEIQKAQQVFTLCGWQTLNEQELN